MVMDIVEDVRGDSGETPWAVALQPIKKKIEELGGTKRVVFGDVFDDVYQPAASAGYWRHESMSVGVPECPNSAFVLNVPNGWNEEERIGLFLAVKGLFEHYGYPLADLENGSSVGPGGFRFVFDEARHSSEYDDGSIKWGKLRDLLAGKVELSDVDQMGRASVKQVLKDALGFTARELGAHVVQLNLSDDDFVFGMAGGGDMDGIVTNTGPGSDAGFAAPAGDVRVTAEAPDKQGPNLRDPAERARVERVVGDGRTARDILADLQEKFGKPEDEPPVLVPLPEEIVRQDLLAIGEKHFPTGSAEAFLRGVRAHEKTYSGADKTPTRDLLAQVIEARGGEKAPKKTALAK